LLNFINPIELKIKGRIIVRENKCELYSVVLLFNLISYLKLLLIAITMQLCRKTAQAMMMLCPTSSPLTPA
jgi:hypothetical protein